MLKVVASLAAVIAALGAFACGGDGAEPGASKEATLVLDFQPNAVHAGIYTALDEGLYADSGVDLTVREPSASTDAPKLLESGRADFAILDIHDLALARERGFDVVGIAPIVQRPLAAVIAGNRNAVSEPADLEGGEVGVTGLPSDDAVLDSVLEAGDADPAAVDRVTIGFEAVPTLSAGRIDAATAFWNAEGVALRRAGISTREFRVDDYGAPRYPELVLTTSEETIRSDPDLVAAVRDATLRGYEKLIADPGAALDDLLAGAEGLDPAEQRAQLDALTEADAFSPAGGFEEDASPPGPTGTSSTGSSRTRSTSRQRSAREQAVDELGHLADEAGARDRDVDAGRLGRLAGGDVRVLVEAEHGRAEDRQARPEARSRGRRRSGRCARARWPGRSRGPTDVVAGGAKRLLDPRTEHQVGGDGEDLRQAPCLEVAAGAELAPD